MKLFAANATKSARQLKLAIGGFTLLLLAAMMIVTDPLQMIVDSQLSIRRGSLLFGMWLRPPLEVLMKVYVFNITNLNELNSGKDRKVKVEEIGPYVYREILEHHNVTFNANNTMTYVPIRRREFVRERSVGDPKVDRIIAPNIPYMGATSAISSLGIVAALGFSALSNTMNAKPILNLTMEEYLWGYDDSMIALASKFMPSFVTFNRFGILDRLFDEGDNLVTMKLPDPKKHADVKKNVLEDEGEVKDYTIDKWNGIDGMKVWGFDEAKNNTPCQTLHGAFDGTLFPRKISPGEKFWVYRKAFCRALPIQYSHTKSYNGIEGAIFKLKENAFDSYATDPQTSCFCKNNQCMKKGLGNVTPCYYSIPLAISFPHFMHADSSLLEGVEGLQPNESIHSTEVVMQPQLGIPMRVHTRFQANLMLGNIRFNSEVAKYSNTALPLLWIDVGVEDLTTPLIWLLNAVFNVLPYVQFMLITVLLIAGSSMLGTALLLCFAMPAPLNALQKSIDVTTGCIEAGKIGSTCYSPLIKQASKELPLRRWSKCKALMDEKALLPQQQEHLLSNEEV